MIHVEAQPEPIHFDREVRQRGQAYLNKKNIPLDQALPSGINLEPYWRNCLDDLYYNYHGICAYLGIFFERVTGGGSVDHFIAKSQCAKLAYEWSNYRLACLTINSRKLTYDTILDPFEVENDWFHLELVSGRIFPNPNLMLPLRLRVQTTIDQLRLDDFGNREMRARHYQEYREGLYTSGFLKKRSPFVWYEAQRQGIL